MSEYRLLVTLHNFVNLPKALAAGETKSFTIVISCCSNNSRSLSDQLCPDITATFNTSDDISVQDRLEVKIETSREWVVHQPVIDVIATVYENIDGTNRRVISVSQPLAIDVANIVNHSKLATRIIGTTLGQAGVSFAVSPTDTEGYAARLRELLQKYNPQGLKLVDSVVKAHTEVEAFTKIYKKYNIVDYASRIQEFFETYGREFISEIPKIMAEWENREEELMRNLILDNGPELRDIELSKRLQAFADRYQLIDLNIEQLVNSGQSPSAIMQQLTRRYGPEPDPRTYYFPVVFYEGPPSNVSPGNSVFVPQQPQPQSIITADSYANRSQNISYSGQMVANGSVSGFNAPGYAYGQGVNVSSASAVGSPTRRHHAGVMGAIPAAPSASTLELWGKFCDDLRAASVPLAELHFINEQAFEALLVELGHPPSTRTQLVAEWQRRVRSALKMERLSAGDPQYEAARRDVLAISGLQPLNLNIVGITALSNSEHENSFATRLAEAKVRSTERLMIVGDYSKLVNVSMYGIAPTPQRATPAAIFYKNPLHVFQSPTSVCLLVCDVVVGKPSTIPDTTTTPLDASAEFLGSYDSCVFTDPVHGPAVSVYTPQQVLPRYIVHCNVDNTVMPCPANPNKPVEYLVVENNAFVCGQCVIMGQYKGKEVVPIEEASKKARIHLSDMHRDADALVKELQTEEEKYGKYLDEILRGEIRENALRMAEQIRREAEQRIQQLLADAESQEATQKHTVGQQKSKIHSLLTEAQQISSMLQERSQGPPTAAIVSLLHLRNNPPVPPMREKARQLLSAGGAAPPGSGASALTKAPAPSSTLRTSPSSAYTSNTAGTTSTTMTAATGTSSASSYSLSNGSGSYIAGGVSPPQQQQHVMPQTDFSRGSSSSAATTSENQDFFSKFRSISEKNQPPQGGGSQHPPHSHRPHRHSPSSNSSLSKNTHSTSSASNVSSGQQMVPAAAAQEDIVAAKAMLKKGWAEYRAKNRAAALALWNTVYERNLTNSAGARAKAYISEAIEGDPEGAVRWYEEALRRDPTDIMTMYNYGVLLESVLKRPQEALQLFESAYRLGDHAAGRRARQIKIALGIA